MVIKRVAGQETLRKFSGFEPPEATQKGGKKKIDEWTDCRKSYWDVLMVRSQ